MFSYLYWNPRREIFTIPYLNIDILWYSLFFALGFIVGYYIFFSFLKRYFLNDYKIRNSDIKDIEILKEDLKKPKNEDQKKITKTIKIKKGDGILLSINSFFESSSIDLKPIKGVLNPKKAALRLFIEKAFVVSFHSIKQKALYVTDQVVIYVVIATIIGARLGHLIFYEDVHYYLYHPLNIIKIWEGGLASHGAALFIVIALWMLSHKLKKKSFNISFLTLLDLISLPTCFAAFCIRIGNFFNQEILGKSTQAFYGIIFGNPADLSTPIPRHPAQLYEAFFYMVLFGFMLFLSFKPKVYLKEGRLIGIFFFFVFTFRFFVEFIKVKQSDIISDGSFLLMGQYLSIPFIILGIVLFFISKKRLIFQKQ